MALKISFPRIRRLSQDRKGSVAVEFALLSGLMITMLLGIGEFGIALYDKLAITDATRAAAREIAIGRSSLTVYDDAVNRFFGSAPGIVRANTTLTVSINGGACASNSACATRLTAATGTPATITAQYPCSIKIMWNLVPGCTLTSATTQRVE